MSEPSGLPAAPEASPRFPAWVQGHRGAKALVPENTVEAFEWAIAHGLHSVELDVRMSADDELMCVHDETLEAYGGPAHPVATMSAASIRGALLTQGSVPGLAEVLALAEGRLGLNIEIKNDPREPSFDRDRRAASTLAGLLDARLDGGHDDQIVAVSSFDAVSVRTFARACATRGDTAALLTPPARDVRRIIREADQLGVTAVHPHHTSLLSAAAITRLLDHGLRVRAWTVNRRRHAERLVRLGVSVVVTDDPYKVADPEG